MKYLKLFICFCLSTSVFAQAQKESFKSEILKDSREISIYTPPNFNKKDKKEYPLLLILDGNYLFDPIHGIISYSSYWEEVPEMIIVAVNFKNFEAMEMSSNWKIKLQYFSFSIICRGMQRGSEKMHAGAEGKNKI